LIVLELARGPDGLRELRVEVNSELAVGNIRLVEKRGDVGL